MVWNFVRDFAFGTAVETVGKTGITEFPSASGSKPLMLWLILPFVHPSFSACCSRQVRHRSSAETLLVRVGMALAASGTRVASLGAMRDDFVPYRIDNCTSEALRVQQVGGFALTLMRFMLHKAVFCKRGHVDRRMLSSNRWDTLGVGIGHR